MHRRLLPLIVIVMATALLSASATQARNFTYRGNSINERLAFYGKVVRYDHQALGLLTRSPLVRLEPKASKRELRHTKRQLAHAERGLHLAKRDYRVWLREKKAAERAARRAAAEAAASTGSTGSTSSGAAPAPSSSYSSVVGIAQQYLGVPYVYGGTSPSTGFDCSGFTSYVFAQVGVSLPHSAAAQYGYGVSVSLSAMQPGDLVFFYGLGHVGIYVGGGSIIHAPSSGGSVEIISMSYMSVVGARRIL